MLVINSFLTHSIWTTGKIGIKSFGILNKNFMDITFYTLSSSAYPNDIRYVGKQPETYHYVFKYYEDVFMTNEDIVSTV